MVHFKEKARYDYDDLLEIIRVLRSPEGCPWDQVQTPRASTGTTRTCCGRSWGTC